jgi:DNA-binding response OmpR family regulator
MTTPLRVLLVEDTERDAALLQLYLRRGGFEPVITRVETRIDLKHRLATEPWDVVVSDFNLPGFDAFAAMKVVQESGVQVPFIVLSAELAPHVIRGITEAGSQFVPKYEMSHIVPVIQRAIDRS